MSKNTCPVAKRLKQARTSVGISQKQLGIAAGMDEFSASARMNQYETGKHVPDFFTLKRIAKVLKYPVPYFYTEEEWLANTIVLVNKLDVMARNKLLKILDGFI